MFQASAIPKPGSISEFRQQRWLPNQAKGYDFGATNNMLNTAYRQLSRSMPANLFGKHYLMDFVAQRFGETRKVEYIGVVLIEIGDHLLQRHHLRIMPVIIK